MHLPLYITRTLFQWDWLHSAIQSLLNQTGDPRLKAPRTARLQPLRSTDYLQDTTLGLSNSLGLWLRTFEHVVYLIFPGKHKSCLFRIVARQQHIPLKRMVSNICPVHSDNQFKIAIDLDCRSLDFTLLFEDTIFSILPAVAFLVWLIPRLEILRRSPVKSSSLRFAIYKSVTFYFSSAQGAFIYRLGKLGPTIYTFCAADTLHGVPSANRSASHQDFDSGGSD